MQVLGKVEIQVRDAVTGELKRTYEDDNHVMNSRLGDFAATEKNSFPHFGPNIFISEQVSVVDRRDNIVFDSYNVGYVASGITSPQTFPTALPTPAYIQFQQRFDPPLADRSINTIGITSAGGVSNIGLTDDVLSHAHTKLAAPCIQTTTEILDIFYRVQLPTGTTITEDQANLLATTHSDGNNVPGYPIDCFTSFSGTQYDLTSGILGTFDYNGTYRTILPSSTGEAVSDLTKRKLPIKSFLSDANTIGRMVGSVGHTIDLSDGLPTVFNAKLLPAGESPVQNTFTHSSASDIPFYDSPNVATGIGTPTIDGAAWVTQDVPNLYEIEITGTGSTGLSTYQVNKRQTLGYFNNTYISTTEALPYLRKGNEEFYGGHTLFQPIYGGAAIHRQLYDDQTVLCIDETVGNTGIILLNFITGATTVWDTTTTPALTATDFAQVTIADDGSIWVACTTTGLHLISADGLTITTMDATSIPLVTATNQCYGVDIGNGKVWAMFEGCLASTSDNGVSWTGYDATTTPSFISPQLNADWSKCWSMHCDRNHGDDHIGYAIDYGLTNLPVGWWDPVAATEVWTNLFETSIGTQPGDSRLDASTNWGCSPNDSVWYCPYNQAMNKCMFLTYGLTTSDRYVAGNVRKTIWIKDEVGNEVPYYGTGVSRGLIRTDGTIVTYTGRSDDRDSKINENAFGVTSTGLLLGERLVYSTTLFNALLICQLGDGTRDGGIHSQYALQRFGWDGANWVAGNTGSKLTHAASNTIIDGLAVSFDDNAGTFEDTDYYTTVVLDGVCLDGATELDSHYALYYKPTEQDITVFEPAVLPAGNSTFTFDESLPTLIDQTNVLITEDVSGLKVDGTVTNDSYCRTEAIDGDFEIRFTSRVIHHMWTVGIAPVRTAVPVDRATMTHSIWMGNSTYTTYFSDKIVYINESGTPAFELPGTAGFVYQISGFSIKRTGTLIEYIMDNKVFYTSSVPSTGPVCVEIDVPHSSQSRVDEFQLRNVDKTGLYGAVGSSGTTTGYYDPDFYKMEYDKGYTINLDGVPATIITTGTPAIGELSVNEGSGTFEYNAADAGKTVTGLFSYVKNQ